jgi:A/G-specific adenine glycosylase
LKRVSSGKFDPAPVLSRWFASHSRDLPWRKNRSLYRVWVSEVMLQQTQVITASGYYKRFLNRFPSLSRLAAASLPEVLKIWEGLGYYARARHLWLAAGVVRDEHNGRIPTSYAGFRKLPGVGEYTAAAVLSIACGQVLAAVDGNVLRVVCRWQGISGDIRLPAIKQSVRFFLETIIPEGAPGMFNEALMELGALVCLPKNPLCRQCPLRHDCFAFGHGKTALLPVKSRKKPVPMHHVALGVILRAGKMFIQQRPETGHLGGLWEFPGGKCRPGEKPELAVIRECREELGVGMNVSVKLAEVHHAYSHFKIILHVFICRLSSGNPVSAQPHAWVKIRDLGKYPFPAANHKFFPLLKKYMQKNEICKKVI